MNGLLVGGDRLTADRRPDHGDPLFPFVRGLWFVVGVQERLGAERASPAFDVPAGGVRLLAATTTGMARAGLPALPLGWATSMCCSGYTVRSYNVHIGGGRSSRLHSHPSSVAGPGGANVRHHQACGRKGNRSVDSLVAQGTGKLVVFIVFCLAAALWMLAVITNFRGYGDRTFRRALESGERFRRPGSPTNGWSGGEERTSVLKVTQIVVVSILLLGVATFAAFAISALVIKLTR